MISCSSLPRMGGWGGGTPSQRKMDAAFRQKMGGKRTLPASADSLLPSAQNNPYARLA